MPFQEHIPSEFEGKVQDGECNTNGRVMNLLEWKVQDENGYLSAQRVDSKVCAAVGKYFIKYLYNVL